MSCNDEKCDLDSMPKPDKPPLQLTKPTLIKREDCDACESTEFLIKPDIDKGKIDVLSSNNPNYTQALSQFKIEEVPYVVKPKDNNQFTLCDIDGTAENYFLSCDDGSKIEVENVKTDD